MEDRSSSHPYPNPHQQRHHPSLLSLPSLQSPELGYTSTQPPLDVLGPYGSRGEQSTSSFPTSSTSFGRRGESSGPERGYPNISGNCSDGETNLVGHLDGENVLGGHFADTWYGNNRKQEVWDEGESCESAADVFYRNDSNTDDVFYTRSYGSENGRDGVDSFAIVCHNVKDKANYNSYANLSYEAKDETVCNKVANVGSYAKHSSLYNRDIAIIFSDSVADDGRTEGHSRRTDSYFGGEEDVGSSQSSSEDQPAQASAHIKSWVSPSPSNQAPEHGEGRWRGGMDSHTLASMYEPQRATISVNSGAYTQKLDSFSKAFLSSPKRGFPMFPGGDSVGRIWKFEAGKGGNVGLGKSSHSCVFDSTSDSYLLASSSPPSHASLHSLPSLPSPPPPSHLMPSVLSPPPTPLPPPSLSPSQMDSSSTFGGVGQSTSDGGESLGTLQFFPSHLQSLPSLHPSGMMWKLPILSHCFPQQSGDTRSVVEGNLRSSHCSDYSSSTAQHNLLQTPEGLVTSSCLHPSRPLCASNSASVRPSLQPPPCPSHLSSLHYKAEERLAPHMMSQEVPGPVSQSHAKSGRPLIYRGTPFPSVLHSNRGQRRGHYTPQPVLNPERRGPGLYSISLHHRNQEVARAEEQSGGCDVPCINVGPDFQAELPLCFLKWEGSGDSSSPEEESPREQLLWKPWTQLEESTNLQGRVERLLSVSSSSCLPGGGSNTELALHCLHSCQGDTMATLEMLLFRQPLPTGDYHYSGSDVWTDCERGLFTSGLKTYGKDFSRIQNMVTTKSVCQCIEFYYLSKKLLDKQRKRTENEDRDGGIDKHISAAPISQPMNRQFGLEGAVPVPSLASFFPCKLCGKMFYKIKSRNAHMKIHRQPQEDWSERRHQHQLLNQRLALANLANNLTPNLGSSLLQPQVSAPGYSSPGLPLTPSNNNNNTSHTDNVVNSFAETSNSVSHSGGSVLNHSAVVTFSNVSDPNPHAITNSNSHDTGSSQRGPATITSLHQSWSSFGLSPNPTTFYCDPEVKEGQGFAPGVKGPVNWSSI